MVTAFSVVLWEVVATTLAVLAAADVLISVVFVAILGGSVGADDSGPALSGFVGLFVEARDTRVSTPAPVRSFDAGLRPLGGFGRADAGAVEPASVPPLDTEELRLSGTPAPRLLVVRLVSPAPIVLDGSPADVLPALLADDDEPPVLLDGSPADVLPALLADDGELPDVVLSAWAIADPLTSAAPTPRVTAPAPSQPYGSRRRWLRRCPLLILQPAVVFLIGLRRDAMCAPYAE